MRIAHPRRLPQALAGVGALAIAALVGAAVGMPTAAHESDGQPARIHRGTCDDYAAVAFELTGVGAAVTPDGTPVAAPDQVGSEAAYTIGLSETTVAAPLSDLTKAEHAIVVYESDEAMDRPIACGVVGGPVTAQMAGMVMPGDELAVGLREQNGSGYAGIALLRADGRSTVVALYLAEGLALDGDGTGGAGATPDRSEADGGDEDDHGAEDEPGATPTAG